MGRPFRLDIHSHSSELDGSCVLTSSGILIRAALPDTDHFPIKLQRGWGEVLVQTPKQGLAFVAFHEAAHALNPDVAEDSADILAIAIYNDLLSDGASDRLEFHR